MLWKYLSGYFVGNGFEKVKMTSQEAAASLTERVLVQTECHWGLGEKGTDAGEVGLAGPSDGWDVGLREGEQSCRGLGGWPKELGNWQLWEMARGGTSLEKGGIQVFHLGRILLEILISMII